MKVVRWATLAIAAAAFAACRPFDTGGVVEEAGGGAADGASPEGGLADSAPPVTDASDAALSFTCAPDASCAGTACAQRCPELGVFGGDVFRFEGDGGAPLQLRGLTDCHLYKCNVVFDNPSDGYDCAKPAPGHTGRACSSSSPTTCPLDAKINVGVNNVDNCTLENCTYECQRIE